MGSAGSKIGKQYTEEDLQKGSVPSTPILTPKITKCEDLDPRSPSTHISRTPLQLLSESLDDLNENDLYSLNNETPVKSQMVMLGIDPRSPTTEFKRTPIVINVDTEFPKKIRNKNLDKVKCYNIISTPVTTPQKPALLEKLAMNIIPPKLLESSPIIKSKADANKRKSFVGLLETNIDFTETDLDAVIQEKCKVKEKLLNETENKCHSIVKYKNLDPRSPTTDFLRTPIQVIKKISEVELNDGDTNSVHENEAEVNNIKQTKIAEELQDHNIVQKLEMEDVKGDDIEEQNTPASIEKEPVSPIRADVIQIKNILDITENKSEYDVGVIDETVVNATTCIETRGTVIPVETKSAPVTPPVNESTQKSITFASQNRKDTKSAPVTPPEVNITADVKELDKKLTNLIYQDEDMVVCPRIVKLKEYNNRSPLRNCNSNEPEKKKSAQKLKVSDKPRKSEYAVSKIPVFKEKGKKCDVQCENTPPRNMEKRKGKARKSRWDNTDTTLII